MSELPMFPLGTVLLPHMVLPLHVFEPRYRQLMHDIEDDDHEFGVVLITRGHEVGGGDERSDVGTVARVVESQELEDGRWVLLAVGDRRVDVRRWLPDDPYPRAEVAVRADRHDDAAVLERHERLVPRVRRVLELQQQVGDPGVGPDVELDASAGVACWQTPVVTPVGSLDRQRLLETDDCARRLDLLGGMVDELTEMLSFRLGAPGTG